MMAGRAAFCVDGVAELRLIPTAESIQVIEQDPDPKPVYGLPVLGPSWGLGSPSGLLWRRRGTCVHACCGFNAQQRPPIRGSVEGRLPSYTATLRPGYRSQTEAAESSDFAPIRAS